MNTTHLVIGSITVTLAIIGLAWVVARVFDGIERAWAWLMRDRVAELLKIPEGTGVLCAGCAGFEHCDGREGACDCTCGWSEDWAEESLPPERTWEQMTSHQLPVGLAETYEIARRDLPGPLEQSFMEALAEEQRERRIAAWEWEPRAAYESLGFDYPSGLMARVRELTP